jgi:hypothetical protein
MRNATTVLARELKVGFALADFKMTSPPAVLDAIYVPGEATLYVRSGVPKVLGSIPGAGTNNAARQQNDDQY